MKLEKVISVNSPTKAFLQNDTNITLNISFLDGTSNYYVNLENISIENNSYISNKSLEFGVNEIIVETEFRNEKFIED